MINQYVRFVFSVKMQVNRGILEGTSKNLPTLDSLD
jgi:hypothetical protein